MTKEEFLKTTESASVVLANFVKDGQTHPLIAKVTQRFDAEYESIKVIDFDLDALTELVEEYESEAHPLSGTLNFDGPGLALYREGELITTFNPWMNLPGDQLNEDAVKRQLVVFLAKLVPDQFEGQAS